MKQVFWLAVVGVGLGALAGCAQEAKREAPAQVQAEQSIYDFQVRRIDGSAASLSDYRGQVLLIVNTASRCGLTPQYEGLEKLHETYGPQGLRVLGFPSNDFMGQEPGTNAEIQQFCASTYGVKFDLFEKISVKGQAQAPLYRFLTDVATNPRYAGEISWNFEKFVIDRSGAIAARFAPSTPPTDPAIEAVIRTQLGL